MSGMTETVVGIVRMPITTAEPTTIALETRAEKEKGTGTEECIGMLQVACKMVSLAEDIRLYKWLSLKVCTVGVVGL